MLYFDTIVILSGSDSEISLIHFYLSCCLLCAEALHRKLLQKAEKEMEAQINDAETCIAAVQKACCLLTSIMKLTG